MTTVEDRGQLLTAAPARNPSKIDLAPADHGRSNVVRLAVAQALAGANSTVVYATGAILGNMLAPDKALATLPVSVLVVGWPRARSRQGRLRGDMADVPPSWRAPGAA